MHGVEQMSQRTGFHSTTETVGILKLTGFWNFPLSIFSYFRKLKSLKMKSSVRAVEATVLLVSVRFSNVHLFDV